MGPDFLDSLSCVCFVSIYLSSVFNSKQFFWPDIRPDIRLSGQPDIRPDIRQTKPDIRPDTGYQKWPDIRPAGYPVQPYF